ncbi:MAG: TauD/TfdA family dioxygenase [Gammaproteobacteria bacterium]|nr:TauD/TfdA family dioxygenase [Gammaproteobacteria bacterium]
MPMYQYFETSPLSGAIGAQVTGLDLSEPLNDAVWAELHQAFIEHLVLAIPGQNISPADQVTLGRRFGNPMVHPFRPSLPGVPEIIPIIKEVDQERNVGGTWHTDLTSLEEPPLGTLLFAREVPSAGGDTMFSNGYAAYENLSAGLRASLESLRAVHSAERAHGPQATKGEGAFREAISKDAAVTAEVEQPVVRTHPKSGRKLLFVNPVFTLRFADWTTEESRPLLDYLYAHMVRPEFVCRVQWQPGTLVIWDNRCTQHYALNDYHGERREMHRLMVEGDRPYL